MPPIGTLIINSLLVGVFSYGLYGLFLAVYRLFFHPLSKFPGPRLAAATYWYEFYYDIIKPPGGQFVFQAERLHELYGPVVRINPDEIQLSKIEWYDTLLTSGKARREIEPRQIRANHSPNAVSSSVSHELHRARRGALNPFFSKRAVTRLEPVVAEKVEQFCKVLQSCHEHGEVIQLDAGMMALTLDVITAYSFGNAWGCLDSHQSWLEWHKIMKGVFEAAPLSKHLPGVVNTLQLLPRSLIRRMNPNLTTFATQQNKIALNVRRIKEQMQEKTMSHESTTIFEELLHSTQITEPDKNIARLVDEAKVVVAAGSETSARLLTTLMYHVLANPGIHTALRKEIREALPDPNTPAKWQHLESLPYLTAVIKESLRVASLVTNRITKVAPDEALQFGDWVIPAKTAISFNLHSLLHDPEVFVNPDTFDPERWMGEGRALEKYFFPFSKGTRNCLGMNLAYAEIYLAVAAIFRRFDVQLYDVVYERDVKAVRDCFVGFPSTESKGLRAQILKAM